MLNTLPPASEPVLADKAFTEELGPEAEHRLAEQDPPERQSQHFEADKENPQDVLDTSATSNAAAVDKECQQLLQSVLAVRNSATTAFRLC